MTIKLTQSVRIAGTVRAADYTVALAADVEADFVARGLAVSVNQDTRRLARPAPFFSRRHAAVIYGDSIGLANWAGPNSAVPDATQNTLSARGYAVAANMLLGWPLEFVWNGGKSGDTTTQMVARMATDLMPYVSPGTVVFLNGGINDVGNDVGSATIIANIELLCSEITGAGGIVSLGTIVPAEYYVTGGSIASRNRALQEANAGFREIARRSPDVYLSDDYAAVVDTSTPYASYLSACTYDDLHPNSHGAMQIARARARSLEGVPFLKAPLVGSVSDFANLIYNPMAAGDNAGGAGGYVQGAGTTGTGPSGWNSLRSGSAAAVCSVVARSDEVSGQWARMAVTGGSLNNYVGWSWTLDSGVNWAAATAYQVGRIRRPTVANGYIYQCIIAGTSGGSEPTWPTTVGAVVADNTATWVCKPLPIPGDLIEASCEFALSGWTGSALAQMFITFTGSAYQANSNIIFSGDTPPLYLPPSGRLRTPITVVPTGATNVIITVACPASAGATGNFDVSQVSARLLNR